MQEIWALEFPSLFLSISSTPVDWHFKSFPSKYKLFTFNPCTLPTNSEDKLIILVSPSTLNKFINNFPYDEVTLDVDKIISPKISFEFSGFIIEGLSPLRDKDWPPAISSSKVQVNSGLSLKLISTPIGHDKSLSPIFKLLIELILDLVVPVISEVNLITNSLPLSVTGVKVIFPKDEYTDSVEIAISLKVSPGELNVATPFKLQIFPPLTILLTVQVNRVPSSKKSILDESEQVII